MRGGTDADRALPVIAQACGLGFSRVKPLSGEHGAVEATVAGRGRYVVKWTWHPHLWPHEVVEVTSRLRSLRYPVPRVIAADRLDDIAFYVQEKLPGSPSDELDVDQLEALIDLVELHAGAAQGLSSPRMSWGEQIHRDLADPGHWTPRKRALVAHSPRAADLVRHIESFAGGLDLSRLPADDVVHTDYGLGNMLFLAGGLSGVIDWDGWRPGDRRADLVTLWFALRIGTDQTRTSTELRRHLRRVMEPELLWAYSAHNVLRTLGWFAFRHGSLPSPTWLAASELLLRTSLAA
ncbi:aminoglycoside phosphotransferase family protein [Kutzneria sp. NPDC051319]|uniref:phosphotransferase family protein n=1 Tax=Kutzneria sp. NPDC051319 TaxID=3155047 RepID=UPI003431D42B